MLFGNIVVFCVGDAMSMFKAIGFAIGGIALVTLLAWGLTVWIARRVEAAIPPAGRFIDLPGIRLHVVEKGQGRPVILLHGIGGQLRHFTYALVDRLADDFHVVAVDRPGMGYSSWHGEEVTDLALQARCVAALIREERLERPLVVGHSLGGALALHLALDYPELVGGLALLAPLTHPQPVPGELRPIAIRSPWLRNSLAWTFATPLSIVWASRTLRRVFAPQLPPKDFMVRGGALLGLRPASFSTLSLELSQLNDPMPAMVERYAELHLPVGILFGDADEVLDPELHGTAMAACIPSLALEHLSGEGHMLPVMCPDACAAFIRRMAEALPRHDRVSGQE